MAEEVRSIAPSSELVSLGLKVRRRRQIKRMSLQQVADKSGVSVGLLSQIERGSSSPSLKSLQLICRALNMPASWIFEDESDGQSEVVVRQASRRRLELPEYKMTKELLSPDSVQDIQLLRIVCEPGGYFGKEPYNAKTGAKCGLVVKGTLGLEIDGEAYTIPTGDSFAFDATRMHRFWCEGDERLEMLWVTAPALY